MDHHHKGFPPSAVGRTIEELRGLSFVAGEFATPALLLREDALAANIEAMQGFCDDAGLRLAPHVKTTMAPEIIDRQLARGAWAVTVATPTQLRTLRHLGVPRVLLANELVDIAAIGWLADQLDGDATFEVYCYVDSTVGVRLLDEALAERGARRPLPVIVELGMPGGRTGARSVDAAVEVALAASRSPRLRVAGVGGFEGIIETAMRPTGLDAVTDYLVELRRTAERVVAIGAHHDEFIVTAGGSAFFELVRDVYDAKWRAARGVQVVLRSGCYVTHDSAAYERFRELMRHRCKPLALVPALELWGRVLSCPEPGRALVDIGKRDVGTDAGFPVPRYVVRRGHPGVATAPELTVEALNDQHAYLQADGGELELAVGDLVGFGISHPCTTFDKWRLIPIVDADRMLVGATRTLF